jgi:hypothetical protein
VLDIPTKPLIIGGMTAQNSLDLRDPAVMLKTLKTAYFFSLDHASIYAGYGRKHLTIEEEKELGARLAQYWMIDDLTHPINKRRRAIREREVNPLEELRELDRIQPGGHSRKVSRICFKGKEATYGPTAHLQNDALTKALQKATAEERAWEERNHQLASFEEGLEACGEKHDTAVRKALGMSPTPLQ